jgi:hypothetical protein
MMLEVADAAEEYAAGRRLPVLFDDVADDWRTTLTFDPEEQVTES